jgi:hypothetical protein
MDDLTDIEKLVLRNLVADRWSKFVVECEQFDGIEPAELYAKLGGENAAAAPRKNA